MSYPYQEHKELRTGLPTGSGGDIGEENSETWSLWEQEQAHARRGSPIAAPTPQPAAPAPEPETEPEPPPKPTTRKKT